MANGVLNRIGGQTAQTLPLGGLGFLVGLLALFCGATSGAAEPSINSYADLPELSGPFSELKDVPASLKDVSVLGTSRGELVILPNSLKLYPNGSGFRVEHNLLSAAGITPGPPARLEFFVQPFVNDLASVMIAASKAFPQMKVGRPQILRKITAEFITSDLFGERHEESILTLASDFSISDLVFVTFEPTHYFIRSLAGDGDTLGVRVSYEISVQDKVRQYQVGMSFAFNCRTYPDSFLDLMLSRNGCPDYELWRLASPGTLADRLSECGSRADSPSSVPESFLNRWKEWKRRDCAITLFSSHRRG